MLLPTIFGVQVSLGHLRQSDDGSILRLVFFVLLYQVMMQDVGKKSITTLWRKTQDEHAHKVFLSFRDTISYA